VSEYIAKATAALEERARAFESLKAIDSDTALSSADKAERTARVNDDIDRLGRVASENVRAAEREAEHAEIQRRAAKLATAHGGEVRAADASDVNAQLRAVARGEAREAAFEVRTPATPGLTGNAAGSSTVPKTFATEILDSLYDNSEILNLARKVVTASGEQIDYPVKVRTSTGRAVTPKSPATSFDATEGTALTLGETEWSTLPLNAFKVGGIGQVSRELIDDSRLDMAGELAGDLGEAIAARMAARLVYGSGSGEPEGLIYYIENTAAAHPATDLATVAALDFDDVIDLFYALPAPYRRRASWLMADALAPKLRKLREASHASGTNGTVTNYEGAYIWQPSVVVGQPDTILGRPIVFEPDMVTTGTDKVVLAIADLSRFAIRVAGGFRVSRSDEYGWDADLVSFKCTSRYDSAVIDGRAVRGLRVDA
jgi:HK97 family phage major capsid protein